MLQRLAVLAVVASLGACGGSGDDDRTTVVAAVYPLAWVAEEVAGPDVEIVNLTPPGAEPHDLELSARDVERVRDATLVLYLGGGFMPALEEAVAGRDNAVDLLTGQTLLEGEDAEADPHVWLDPLRLVAVAGTVGAELGAADAAVDLGLRLESLHRDLRAGLADCARREIVTSHAAFGYLAQAYDLEQIALTGISPESEPSPRALEELVEAVQDSGATTVFFETLVSPRLAETVAREAGVRTAALNPLEGLTRKELEAGEDYLSVMRRNLVRLREALACR